MIDVAGKKFNKLTAIKFEYKKSRKNHWLFKCDCGKEKILSEQLVRGGFTKSCGCLVKENHFCLGEGEASFNNLLYIYKRNSFDRDLEFKLTKEEFRQLTKEKCNYCGESPNKSFQSPNTFGDYIYNGIDRVDNSKGYILENCVTCCEFCNRAKLDKTKEDFINWIKRAAKHLENKNE